MEMSDGGYFMASIVADESQILQIIAPVMVFFCDFCQSFLLLFGFLQLYYDVAGRGFLCLSYEGELNFFNLQFCIFHEIWDTSEYGHY